MDVPKKHEGGQVGKMKVLNPLLMSIQHVLCKQGASRADAQPVKRLPDHGTASRHGADSTHGTGRKNTWKA